MKTQPWIVLSIIPKREDIRTALLCLARAITDAKIVVGPDKEEPRPNPAWCALAEDHEAVAIGTIFWDGNEATIHIHKLYCKQNVVKVARLGEQANTFLVLEAIILEITGAKTLRKLNPKSNMVHLKL